MGEMPVAEGSQRNRAELRGSKIDADMRLGGESGQVSLNPQESMEIAKKKRAVQFANEIAELNANLDRAKRDMKTAGNLAPTFEKIIASLEEEIEQKEIEFAGEAGTDVAL